VSGETEQPEKKTCCVYRRKIVVGIIGVLTEEACGVSDVEMADLYDPDRMSPSGKPVLAIRFCCWCGARITHENELRVSDLNQVAEPDPADYWKDGDDDSEDDAL